MGRAEPEDVALDLVLKSSVHELMSFTILSILMKAKGSQNP